MSTETIIGYGDGISTDEGVRDSKAIGVFNVGGGSYNEKYSITGVGIWD